MPNREQFDFKVDVNRNPVTKERIVVRKTVVKARLVAGVVVLSIPRGFMDLLGASIGDYLEIIHTDGIDALTVQFYSKPIGPLPGKKTGDE
jgi:hypothetical protein